MQVLVCNYHLAYYFVQTILVVLHLLLVRGHALVEFPLTGFVPHFCGSVGWGPQHVERVGGSLSHSFVTPDHFVYISLLDWRAALVVVISVISSCIQDLRDIVLRCDCLVHNWVIGILVAHLIWIVRGSWPFKVRLLSKLALDPVWRRLTIIRIVSQTHWWSHDTLWYYASKNFLLSPWRWWRHVTHSEPIFNSDIWRLRISHVVQVLSNLWNTYFSIGIQASLQRRIA